MLARVISNNLRSIAAKINKVAARVNKAKTTGDHETFRIAHKALGKLIPPIVRTDRTLAEMAVVKAKPTIIVKRSFKFTPDMVPEMVTIPSGTFDMGGTEESGPVREVIVSCFGLGKYEVTNKEYMAYRKANRFSFHDHPQLSPKSVSMSSFVDPGKPRHPVVNVTWNDAIIYCNWLSEMTGRKFRLPTEAEGEYAARGTDGLEYPWGNIFKPSFVTYKTKGTSRVDAHPKGISPCRIMDLSGNVWEWRSDWFSYGYDPKDVFNPKGPRRGDNKVLRGGSWDSDNPLFLHNAFRRSTSPHNCSESIGFRVAEDL